MACELSSVFGLCSLSIPKAELHGGTTTVHRTSRVSTGCVFWPLKFFTFTFDFFYFNVYSSNLTMRRMIGSSCGRAGKVLFHRTESFIPPHHFRYSSETFEMEATKFFSNGFLPHYPRNNFIGGTRRFSITYNPWSSCRTSPYLFKRINAFVSDVPSKSSSQNSVIFYFPFC